jgi:hypothetical protein
VAIYGSILFIPFAVMGDLEELGAVVGKGSKDDTGGGKGCFRDWLFVMRVAGLVVASAEGAKVFEDFRVEDGRADFVDAGGPLAEVDLAAAVTAEREVFAVEGDEFVAGGAAEEFGGFFLGCHGVLGEA